MSKRNLKVVSDLSIGDMNASGTYIGLDCIKLMPLALAKRLASNNEIKGAYQAFLEDFGSDGITITPRSSEQKKLFANLMSNATYNIVDGPAGTGKSMIATAVAIAELDRGTACQKIIVLRPELKNRGYLRGGENAKTAESARPMHRKLHELGAVGLLLELQDINVANTNIGMQLLESNSARISFLSPSAIVGDTWDNAIILVDDSQSLNAQIMHHITTRVGRNSRMFIIGDMAQITNECRREMQSNGGNGFEYVLNYLGNPEYFDELPKEHEYIWQELPFDGNKNGLTEQIRPDNNCVRVTKLTSASVERSKGSKLAVNSYERYLNDQKR